MATRRAPQLTSRRQPQQLRSTDLVAVILQAADQVLILSLIHIYWPSMLAKLYSMAGPAASAGAPGKEAMKDVYKRQGSS